MSRNNSAASLTNEWCARWLVFARGSFVIVGPAEGKTVAKLLDPSEDKREAFLRMAQDWRDHGNDRYRLALEDFDAYLARVDRFRDAAQIPVGWVPGLNSGSTRLLYDCVW